MLQQDGWLMTVISMVGILGSWRLSLKIASIFSTSREHLRHHKIEFSRSREFSPYMPNVNLVHVKKYWLPQYIPLNCTTRIQCTISENKLQNDVFFPFSDELSSFSERFV